MPGNDLVLLIAFATQMEADLAKSALASAGIVALIQSDSVGGMRPHVGFATGGYRLLVREEDEDDAREILRLPDDE
jgi:hypothetical protein